MTTPPILCHLLIGPPASGKSTLATQMQQIIPQAQIISTDHIRTQLYNNETTQGHWPDIEKQILTLSHQAIQHHRPIIYDATNSQRHWRMALLHKLKTLKAQWLAWHLKTPLTTCHQWNNQRPRQVPPDIIDEAHNKLKQYPPLAAEGFLAVYPLSPHQTNPIDTIQQKLKQLNRNLTNKTNRTQNKKTNLHRYSKLIDFDRLMHLISLLINHPGLGNLSTTHPQYLATLIDQPKTFPTSLSEISTVIAHQRSPLYANPSDLEIDLNWLDQNGFTQATPTTAPLTVPSITNLETATHAYSDAATFKRLLTLIRFILHHPFQNSLEDGNSLQNLAQSLLKQGIFSTDESAAIRKDIQQILKPYHLLPSFRLKRGYFMGTGILSEQQLIKTFTILETQAKHLDDPIALDIFETFKDRIDASKHLQTQQYPVRAIYNRVIVDTQQLPTSALLHSLDTLESDIEQGTLIELNHLPNVGRFQEKPDSFFLAWPLQIAFYNIGWYLGYEIATGPQTGLLQFERLDRLFRGQPQSRQRSRTAQETSLHKLHQLYQASGSLYLGKDVAAQTDYISQNATTQTAVTQTLELWFTDKVFPFITEGNQRFQPSQMRMSPKLTKQTPPSEPLFSLPKSPDPKYPNRFQVKLPCWALDSTDLRRWILGFGGQTKVAQPTHLAQRIQTIGTDITTAYRPD